MAKILKEKGFNDVLLGQKLCRQCVTKYEKLTKPPENENMTEIIETESSQDEFASEDDFLLYESPKKGFKCVFKTSNILDVEIEEPPPIYDRDTKNKAEELDRLDKVYRKIANIDFGHKRVIPAKVKNFKILEIFTIS